MRDKIEKILSLQGCEGYDAIGEILALIAPELEKAKKYDALCLINDPIQIERELFLEMTEKAEKWDKVEEAANSTPPCKCPLWHEDCNHEYGGCIFRDVVDALNQPEVKPSPNGRG